MSAAIIGHFSPGKGSPHPLFIGYETGADLQVVRKRKILLLSEIESRSHTP
jgi:hypothetical protein